MSTPWRRHCSPKIAGASLWNHVPNSEVGRLFCFFFAARRPSQLLSTYYDCRQLVQLSAHLCLQHVGRAVERRAVPLRQSTLVIAAVSRVCHIACPAHAPFYSAPDREAEYCDERVCVCVFVRDHVFGTTRPIFTKSLCVLPMPWLDRSSGGVMIRYVLPVLWMTSYLLISQSCSTSPPS